MNSDLLLLLISFLIMCQLIRAAAIIRTSESSPSSMNNCSNFVITSLDFVNIEKFRSNVKLDLKRFNCTQPGVVNVTEVDLVNSTKDSFAVSSEIFCSSVQNITSWKPLNLSSYLHLDHLVKKIFNNHTLCVVVCTKDLNETLWPYCEAIRNVTQEKVSLIPVTKPLQPETGNKAVNPSINIDPVPLETNENDNRMISSLDLDSDSDFETPNVKPPKVENKTLNVKPPRVEKTPDSNKKTPNSNKKTPQPETVKTSNPSGAHPLASDDLPSKSLPQTAIVDSDSGKPNLKPENDESHYFIYFVVMSILCIFCYVGIYNKKKILALMIEGRKQKDRRRHASAGYRKLNTNLEEAVPLGTSAPTTDSMIY